MGPPPSSLYNQSAFGVDIDSFQSYQYPVNFKRWVETVAFRNIWSFHFLHLWVYQRVNCTIPPNMWGPLYCGKCRSPTSNILFLGWVRHLLQLSELTTVAFRATKILSEVGVYIPIDCNFQNYQNPVKSGS